MKYNVFSLFNTVCSPDSYYIWDKLFKNEPSKICERQPLKDLKESFKFFKGCLPQILLGPFLNTLSYLTRITQSGIRFILIHINFDEKYFCKEYIFQVFFMSLRFSLRAVWNKYYEISYISVKRFTHYEDDNGDSSDVNNVW